MRKGSHHTPEAKAKVGAANRGRVMPPGFGARISAILMGNRRADGNQNARKVTTSMRAEIWRLKREEGLGCRRIGKRLGVDKSTVQNVFKGKH